MGQETTANARDGQPLGHVWSKHSGLIAVFAAVQLCVGLKYFSTGLMQVRDKLHPQRVEGLRDSDGAEAYEGVAGGFPMPAPGRFLSGSLQHDFEVAARKQFPWGQAGLVPRYCRLATRFSNLSLAAIPTPPTAPTPLWGEFTLVQDGDGARICERPTFYREADRRKLADRAAYYNGLHASWPRVRFHVFPILAAADWCAVGGRYGAGAMRQLAGDRYVRELRALLDPALGCTWEGEGGTCRDALARHYRTDHHWNFRGAYEIYRQLWQLLGRENPQIGPPIRVRGWTEVPNVVFYGSLAYRAGCYDAFGDEIVDGILDLPELKVHIHGFEGTERNGKRQYWAGHYNRAEFTNHYAEYFGTDYGLIEYTSGAAGRGQLLVIGDSYDNCLEPLLASHFTHSWFADLRLYAKDVREEFDLDDFLARHEITDVLFVGGQQWVLGLQPLEPYEFR